MATGVAAALLSHARVRDGGIGFKTRVDFTKDMSILGALRTGSSRGVSW